MVVAWAVARVAAVEARRALLTDGVLTAAAEDKRVVLERPRPTCADACFVIINEAMMTEAVIAKRFIIPDFSC